MEANARALSGIKVIYEEEVITSEDGAKGIFASDNRITRRLSDLDLPQFTANLQAFCEQVSSVFEKVTTAIHHFELKTFELTLDVTAKGEVRFIGSAGTEIKGGLKVIFEESLHNEFGLRHRMQQI
jgi:hypothetical protein